LIHPQTADQKERAEILRDKFKMDPVVMRDVDEKYGPLEWRLPEAHAIYWAVQGLAMAKKDGRRIDPSDLIMLRRVIYQSMQLSFQRGRLIADNAEKHFEFGPNLDIIPKVSAAYEEEMDNDAKNRDHIEKAHRNFLRDAVYALYEYDRQADAIRWYRYLAEKYPDKPVLLRDPTSLPRNLPLDEYVIARIQDEVKSPGQSMAKGIIEGMETVAFRCVAIGDDKRAAGLDRMAQLIWKRYATKVGFNETTSERLSIGTIPEIKKGVLAKLLNGGLPPELAAVLASKTGQKWPPEKPVEPGYIPPPQGTNSTPATNAPEVNLK